ncbi:VacJ family lipoprotein [Candidatus Nitronereus thalassa]|uniref:VacJ family lipoprotein n=1 Tax=Candidatus Nitronereus thalassa TaxID=3020898 RepID=A0ABU3KCH2_9BACT|nr:VacJ family lipoprotein [Candidatus Nitronereus thalassa]MDT7043929.1 VacJ family lipoprotein [Candidatus Nitronereus thalassa]
MKLWSNQQRPLAIFSSLLVSLGVLMGGTDAVLAAGSSDDPIEVINRPIYHANDILDQYVGEPISRVYIDYTPEMVRSSVSNFFDNVSYLNVILNDFLQGKGKQGVEDSSRFLINSTFGALGLFDIATPLGLEKHNEDFGQTLAVWGVGQGSYLVLPFLGPNTARDVPDLGFSTVTNILFYVSNPVAVPVAVLGFIDKRSRFDQAIQIRNEVAVEPYLFTREAYLQHRNFLIYDGNPPIEDEDLFLDEPYAELEKEGPVEIEDTPEQPTPNIDPQARNTDLGNASVTVSIR